MLYRYLAFMLTVGVFALSAPGCIQGPSGPHRDSAERLNELSAGQVNGGVMGLGGEGELPVELDVGGAVAGVEGAVMSGQEAGVEAGVEAGIELTAGVGVAGVELPPQLELPTPPREDERCDGLDNDLDGAVDEGVSNPCGGCAPLNPDEELSCQSWAMLALHSVEGGEVTPLDPTRLFAQAGVVSRAWAVALPEGSEPRDLMCDLLSVEAGPLPQLGRVGFDSPLASLALVYQPLSGRYEPVGGADLLAPLVTHREGDLVELSWEGFDERLGWGSFPAGQLSVRSPPVPGPSSGALLDPIFERFAGRLPEGEPAQLRWRPEGVSAAPTSLPAQELSLYVGGSRAIIQRSDYREIHHFQLGLTLADDGEYTLPLSMSGAHPGSALWVYLERAERAWVGSALHSITARVGHRVERRQPASGAPETWQTPIRLTSPPQGQEALNLENGLEVSWAPVGDGAYESLTLSLVLQGLDRLTRFRCELDSSVSSIRLPVSDWPNEPDALRLLTLRANLKSGQSEGADRGRYSEGVSLLQYLPPRAP